MPNYTDIFLLVALVAFIGLVVAAIIVNVSRRRHEELVRRFGPEYERTVDELGSETRADRELLAREKRVRHLRLRRLSDTERRQFTAHWQVVQASFFDDPVGASRKADEVIRSVMQARGYTPDHFEQRVADLSVDHASVVQHYRAARALASANQSQHPDVDELRQAILHYRALFVELLSEPEPAERHFWRPRHAH